MEREPDGYFSLFLEHARPQDRYFYRLDRQVLRPDPSSRSQPEGVHGPSRVVSLPSGRSGRFSGHRLGDLVFYEVHVGTFSPESTFDGVLSRLDHLVDLGITALELMPVTQFPGTRNWGYDGAFPYAVQNSYGGPEGLLRLVDGCHERDLSVFLDVVHNHLGPEGNYLSDFGPYFSMTTRTPWGEALNFDERHSDHVRHFFLENIRYFADTFDIDGFRFDAVHAIRDQSAQPFLSDISILAERIARRRHRPLHLVAESNLNDRRTVLPRERDGMGFDSQWNDDFHHALHVTFTKEKNGYFADFSGGVDLASSLEKGFVYRGQHAPSFGHRRGSSSGDLPGHSFVFFAQNHDQVGNRMRGDRLTTLLPSGALRTIAALVLLSPGLPLLFMGEEYGELKPFLYFTSHGDPDLVRAVREGRAQEFSGFGWSGEVPDPQDPKTFEGSRLTAFRNEGTLSVDQTRLLAYHRHLIGLRRTLPPFAPPDSVEGSTSRVFSPAQAMIGTLRGSPPFRAFVLFNYGPFPGTVPLTCLREWSFPRQGRARIVLDSGEERWGGEGTGLPDSFDSDDPPEEISLDGFQVVAWIEEAS